MNRASLITAALVALAILAAAPSCYSAEEDFAPIKAEVAKRHDEAVKRLQDWIKQVSIAAEDRGFPEGAEHMAQLAKEASFQRAEVVQTKGKPGVFATLDAGAAYNDFKNASTSSWLPAVMKKRTPARARKTRRSLSPARHSK